MAATVTVNDLLDGHVVLDLQCLDRIYLNGYVPNLQVGGQVVTFMTKHLGYRIPSPAIMEKIGTRFRQDVNQFAEDHSIPIVRFGKDDRKIDVMRSHLDAQAATGRSGVAAIGVAQELQNVFASTERSNSTGVPWYTFNKADRRVTCFYFYLWDTDFGSSFIKICTYFPYPIKVWVNGHEWAKRQTTAAGIGYVALPNGFASCDDPAALQEICDRLGSGTIEVFFERWMSRLPLPLTEHDRTDGYWWELSMRQVEVSRTLVFDAPRRARAFFEALVVDNLDIGRPDTVELIFKGPPHRRGWRPVKLGCTPRTSLVTRDTDVTVNALCFTNRSLRAQVSRLLGVPYTVNQMSYDLGRLRLNRLIERIPDSNTYTLTADGQRVAIFYTKVHNRLLRPLLAGHQPPAPAELRDALRTIDQHVRSYIDHARLRKAA